MNGRHLSKLLCLLISVAGTTHALESSSEGVNPFNQFMKPNGGVNLVSGDVAFSLPLAALRSVGDLSIGAALAYSSNVHMNARAANHKAPTGWVGLGWRLGYGAIRCEHNGTMTNRDDAYYWVSPEGVSQRILPDAAGDYYLERNP